MRLAEQDMRDRGYECRSLADSMLSLRLFDLHRVTA